jgi:hypothetical protein
MKYLLDSETKDMVFLIFIAVEENCEIIPCTLYVEVRLGN